MPRNHLKIFFEGESWAWSLLVIALAWLFYRPLIGAALLAIAAALIFAFSQKGKALRERIVSAKK